MLKKLSLYIGSVTLAGIISCYLLLDHHLKQPLNLNSSQLLTIKSGTSFNAFSQKLVADKWIVNNFWLKIYTKIDTDLAKIKIGTYLITPNTNLLELLAQVVAGKEHQFTITFIEGSTLKQWVEQLNQHRYIKHTFSNELAKNWYSLVASELKLSMKHPEGLFFPDTYSFVNQTTDIEILRRAYQKMEHELEQAWSARLGGLPYETPYQALIMASIIEKESGKHAEHELISSVFVNRLNIGMRLQTDPTIIYGLGERYKGDIKRKHKREKTPYNTYRIDGLPPTPIAMPGKSAIIAALNPVLSDYYYFVSDGKGQHVFSTTLVEHNQAVRRYLQEMRSQVTDK